MISYGADLLDTTATSRRPVDGLLKGENEHADLRFCRRQTKYDIVINSRQPQALGLTSRRKLIAHGADVT